jgi:Flp pilus assembly protein TadG
LFPFLCFAFVIALDFARVVYYSVAVTNCARSGALYGSADQTHSLDKTGIKSAAQAEAPNLTTNSIKVDSSTDSSTSPKYVTVTVTYPFDTIVTYPGVPSQMTLSRTVKMEVVPTVPKFN